MSNKTPGLTTRKRKDGVAYYWVAKQVTGKARGYPTPTVRLHGATDEAREARCRILTAELQEWLGASGGPSTARYDGTIASLIRCYQTDEESPYRSVRPNTRREYDYTLRLIEEKIGAHHVEGLTRKNLAVWYRNWREPATPGGPLRTRRAHGCMKLIRIVMGFGKSMRYAGCRDIVEILEEMRFEQPKPRDRAMTLAQAEAVIAEALAAGLRSIALAQALQFELSLRQKDVIGEWLKDRDATGIVNRGARWASGLLWSDVSADLILTKRTSKTDTPVEWSLRLYPLAMRVLDLIPAGERIGPMIVCEATGRPYRQNHFQQTWRSLADRAGVPRDVWNMDSRAGGITEGDAAGADPRDLQRHASHSDFTTTQRYIRSTTRKATEKVAQLRVAARGNKGSTTPL